MTEYQVVSLNEKKVAGLKARTSNDSPEMGQIIGGLWQQLFGKGIFGRIPGKCNERSIGLYSDYGEDGYDITVGCEVTGTQQLPEELSVKVIPAGKYAEFVVYGDDAEAVGRLWGEIWQMPLDRTYTGDFEEYYEGGEDGNREIHVFVAIR